jgi:hypothetical protein
MKDFENHLPTLHPSCLCSYLNGSVLEEVEICFYFLCKEKKTKQQAQTHKQTKNT